MPGQLERYLVDNQRLFRADGQAQMHLQLLDAISRHPTIYVPELDAHHRKRYRFVALWPHANLTRPLAEINLVYHLPREFYKPGRPYQRERLHLVQATVTLKDGVLRDKAELLQASGLFFYVNFGVESDLTIVQGCGNAFRRHVVPVDYPAKYRGIFKGRP